MPRDRRVGRVRQAELLQADAAAAAPASRRDATVGKKPSTQHLRSTRRGAARRERAADQPRALAEHRDRVRSRAAGRRSSISFATRHWCHSDCSCQVSMRCPSCSSRCCTQAGEREVHVVAAEQDVIADRDALEREVAVLLADQRSGRSRWCRRRRRTRARRSPTRELLAPVVAGAVEPGVERGLRLLEQRDVLEPGGVGRAQRQLARAASNDAGTVRSTSCRASAQRRVGGRERASHAAPQVPQVARRGLDRRQLRHLRRARPTAESAPCGSTPRVATATTWPTRPAAPELSAPRLRASSPTTCAAAPACPTAARCCPRGNRGRRGRRGTTAAATAPRLRPG